VKLASSTANRTVFTDVRIGSRPFRFTFQMFETKGHTYRATIGVPTREVVETLDLFRAYLLMFAPLLFLAAAGGGYWLSRRLCLR